MVSLIREAVLLVLNKGEAGVGAVAPLRDVVPDNATDGSADRKRRESPMGFVEAGLVVIPGQESGSVWLRIEVGVLPDVELEAIAVLPLRTAT